jgi:TldD protein
MMRKKFGSSCARRMVRLFAGVIPPCICLTLTAFAVTAPSTVAVASNSLLDTMGSELSRAMLRLSSPAQPTTGSEAPKRPYFASYHVSDTYEAGITAQFGGLAASNSSHTRVADIVVRVGEPKLDNAHGNHRGSVVNTVPLPLADDPAAIGRALWWGTNGGYANALQNYQQVQTDTKVRAREEDSSADFSLESPQVDIQKAAVPSRFDQKQWEQRMRSLSAVFRSFPEIYSNFVSLQVRDNTDYFVSSEGAKLVHPHHLARVVVFASSRAEDGMDLFRAQTFEAETPDTLPTAQVMEDDIRKLAASLGELRKAPATQPFDGPAILSGRAAAVFFHEVLGHRLEGQRQRGDEEGQTFTKDLGKPILPSFLSVADDPTQRIFENTYLSGSYAFDDEGQKARRVDLIEDGVLKTFLMSRLPIASFDQSNGHGRSQVGHMPTGRQGNLIVTSTKTVPEAELRRMLIEEAKKQGKPFGLYFEDISSGFAVTTRNAPQAFSVLPLVVYRVYVDGRPDELVRGVSIVGTPQAALNRILATGNTREVFNGECGAESGSIPVSAVAPAVLMSEIETQRQPQGTSRTPILPPPYSPEAQQPEAH